MDQNDQNDPIDQIDQIDQKVQVGQNDPNDQVGQTDGGEATHDEGVARAAGPTCKCGFRIGDRLVYADPHYSWWGWCTILFGISTRPTKLTYRCRQCEMALGETDDPETLERFV